MTISEVWKNEIFFSIHINDADIGDFSQSERKIFRDAYSAFTIDFI